MAKELQRLRELEPRITELSKTELGIILAEYLKLDWTRNCRQLISAENDCARGRIQEIESIMKLLSVDA